MKILEFRFWDNKKKKFIHDDQYDILGVDSTGDAISCSTESCESPLSYMNDSITVEQFTGLFDNTDKKIFDGDIVKVTNKASQNGIKVVTWDDINLCYALVWPERYSENWNSNDGYTYNKVSLGIHCTILGNIHENPELLTF